MHFEIEHKNLHRPEYLEVVKHLLRKQEGVVDFTVKPQQNKIKVKVISYNALEGLRLTLKNLDAPYLGD